MIWKHIGYTMNEALGYGVPIITTPLSVLKELPVTDEMKLVCEWDMSNVDEIVKEIFERKVKPFNYIPPEDGWKDLLKEGKSTYKEEIEKMKKVRFLVDVPDKYTGEKYKKGQEVDFEDERVDEILSARRKADGKPFAELVEEIETATKKVKTEKAVKKTIKKAK